MSPSGFSHVVVFTGGAMSGARVRLPAAFDAAAADLTITPGGVVFDRATRRPVRDAVVVQMPTARGIADADAIRPGPRPRRSPFTRQRGVDEPSGAGTVARC